MRQVSYTAARDRLADVLDDVEQNREIVVIERRGHENVALIAESELTGLLETAHLLRSPRNAKRLMAALERALADDGAVETVEQLKRSVGLLDG